MGPLEVFLYQVLKQNWPQPFDTDPPHSDVSIFVLFFISDKKKGILCVLLFFFGGFFLLSFFIQQLRLMWNYERTFILASFVLIKVLFYDLFFY